MPRSRIAKFLLPLFVPAALIGTEAGAQGQNTTAQIAEWCVDYPKGDRAPLCRLYINEMIELLQQPNPVMNGGRRTCVPNSVPLEQVVGEFTTWLNAHPAARNWRPIEAVGAALQPKYPCR